MLDTMFEIPGSDVKSVHIDDDCVRGTASPKYVRKSQPLDETEESARGSEGSNDEDEGAQVRVQQ